MSIAEMIKRQNVLSKGLVDGTLKDDEKKELERLTAAISAMMNGDVEVGKTQLGTMTLAEFKKHVQTEMSEAGMDAMRLALLKRNIDSVKKQGKKNDDDIVAVECLVSVDANDERLSVMEQKLDELMGLVKGATFDGRSRTGVLDHGGDGDGGGEGGGEGDGGDGEGDGTNKGDKPTAMALASEALDTIISRFNSLKEKLGTGGITMEDLNKAWPSWSIREILDVAVSITEKLGHAHALAVEVLPELQKISDGNKDDGGSGDGDGDGGNSGDGGSGEDDGDVSKSVWADGGDLTKKAAKLEG